MALLVRRAPGGVLSAALQRWLGGGGRATAPRTAPAPHRPATVLRRPRALHLMSGRRGGVSSSQPQPLPQLRARGRRAAGPGAAAGSPPGARQQPRRGAQFRAPRAVELKPLGQVHEVQGLLPPGQFFLHQGLGYVGVILQVFDCQSRSTGATEALCRSSNTDLSIKTLELAQQSRWEEVLDGFQELRSRDALLGAHYLVASLAWLRTQKPDQALRIAAEGMALDDRPREEQDVLRAALVGDWERVRDEAKGRPEEDSQWLSVLSHLAKHHLDPADPGASTPPPLAARPNLTVYQVLCGWDSNDRAKALSTTTYTPTLGLWRGIDYVFHDDENMVPFEPSKASLDHGLFVRLFHRPSRRRYTPSSRDTSPRSTSLVRTEDMTFWEHLSALYFKDLKVYRHTSGGLRLQVIPLYAGYDDEAGHHLWYLQVSVRNLAHPFLKLMHRRWTVVGAADGSEATIDESLATHTDFERSSDSFQRTFALDVAGKSEVHMTYRFKHAAAIADPPRTIEVTVPMISLAPPPTEFINQRMSSKLTTWRNRFASQIVYPGNIINGLEHMATSCFEDPSDTGQAAQKLCRDVETSGCPDPYAVLRRVIRSYGLDTGESALTRNLTLEYYSHETLRQLARLQLVDRWEALQQAAAPDPQRFAELAAGFVANWVEGSVGPSIAPALDDLAEDFVRGGGATLEDLCRFVFEESRFSSALGGNLLPQHLLLGSVLKNRSGSSTALGVVLLAIGRRARLSLQLVEHNRQVLVCTADGRAAIDVSRQTVTGVQDSAVLRHPSVVMEMLQSLLFAYKNPNADVTMHERAQKLLLVLELCGMVEPDNVDLQLFRLDLLLFFTKRRRETAQQLAQIETLVGKPLLEFYKELDAAAKESRTGRRLERVISALRRRQASPPKERVRSKHLPAGDDCHKIGSVVRITAADSDSAGGGRRGGGGGMLGVVCKWEPTAERQTDIAGVQVLSFSRKASQPFYEILAEDGLLYYIAHERLQGADQREVEQWAATAPRHIGHYFRSFTGSDYVPNRELAKRFPEL